MVEPLIVSSLVLGFALAMLEYVPVNTKVVYKLFNTPLFTLLFSLSVSVLVLFLLGLSGTPLILVALGSTFLGNLLFGLTKKL